MHGKSVNTLPRASLVRTVWVGMLTTAVVAFSSGSNCVNTGGGGGGGNTEPTVCGTLTSPPIIIASDHVLGSASATVTVVEYGDFQCPFCGQFARNTFPTIKQEYIDTGKVRWVWRHFPLTQIHANAQKASEASECVTNQDSDKFWDYADVLFNHQSALDVASLKTYAGQLGLDQPTFDNCLDTGAETARVQQDVNSGNALGLTGTPSFYVNKGCYAGAYSVARFRQILDQELAAAASP